MWRVSFSCTCTLYTSHFQIRASLFVHCALTWCCGVVHRLCAWRPGAAGGCTYVCACTSVSRVCACEQLRLWGCVILTSGNTICICLSRSVLRYLHVDLIAMVTGRKVSSANGSRDTKHFGMQPGNRSLQTTFTNSEGAVKFVKMDLVWFWNSDDKSTCFKCDWVGVFSSTARCQQPPTEYFVRR